MPGQGRLGDKANSALDVHGCPACPHPTTGPAIQGSPDVNVNGRPALRVDDPGIHAACCGTTTWTATSGSLTVFINGKCAHRMGDQTRHCGGQGRLVEGSPNVMVGETASIGVGAFPGIVPTAQSAIPGRARASAGIGHPASATTVSKPTAPSATRNRSTEVGTRSTAPPSSADPFGAGTPEPESQNAPARDEPTWLEIVLVGEDGKGLPGERYTVVLPDGTLRTGFLDEDGRARFEDLVLGNCKVSFPDLDSEAWADHR